MNVESKVRLLADDTALYVTISTSSQSEILQKYLDNLERWSHKWDMVFNPSKCQVIHITRSKTIPTQYTLHNCILQSVSSTKYLGVDISSDLSWDTHKTRISEKANNTLDIMIYSESLKSSACKVLVHPKLEYCSTVCVHSQIQISPNLKLSNIELPNGSNMAMDRLPVSQTWCNSLLCIKSLTI